MKRLLTAILTLIIVLCVAGCNSHDNSHQPSKKTQSFFTAKVVEVHKDHLLLNVSDAGNSNFSKNNIVEVSTDVVAAVGCPEFEPNEYARVVIANDVDISQKNPIEALAIYKTDENGNVITN